LSDQHRRARHQQGKGNQVVQDAVAHRFAKGVRRNVQNAGIHVVTAA